MCLGVCLPVCLCTHAWLMFNRLAKGTGFSGTAVTDSCAPLCDADDSSQFREESHFFAPKHDDLRATPAGDQQGGKSKSIFKSRALTYTEINKMKKNENPLRYICL